MLRSIKSLPIFAGRKIGGFFVYFVHNCMKMPGSVISLSGELFAYFT